VIGVSHVLVEGVGKVVDVGVGILESVLHALHTSYQGLKIVIRDVSMSLVRLLGGAAPSGLRLRPRVLPLLLLLYVLVPLRVTLFGIVLQKHVLISGQGPVLLPLHSKSIGKRRDLLLSWIVSLKMKVISTKRLVKFIFSQVLVPAT
jgi:hypothetical protein